MRILITGGTNGMGKGVAQVLAAEDDARHEVVILGRSQERCEATVQEISAQSGNPKVSFVRCDLAKLGEVRAAIADIRARTESLDALFVNAGLGYAPSKVVTEDGMDPHFQVNYLSQFMLTLHLLPLLERSEHGGRVVFNAADFGELDFEDLQMEKNWGYERGIGQGMVAKRMLVVQLHQLCAQRPGCDLSFMGFHIHKTVWTNQLNIIPRGMRLMAMGARLLGQFISIERCGEIMAPLFTDDAAQTRARSGKLLTWKKGAFVEMPHTEQVLDAASRQRLWQQSLELCADEETTRRAEAVAEAAVG